MKLDALALAHVMIVDDQPDRLQHYQEVISAGGFPGVMGILNPLMIGSRKSHLTLLESELGMTSWVEVLRHLMQMHPRRYYPVIVALADREEERHLQALRGGAMDFILKPVPREELLARMRKLLALTQRFDAAGEPGWPPEDEAEVEEYIRSARVLILDDQPMQLMYMQKFFGNEGFEDVTAHSDPMALLDERVRGEGRYDLVVCDYHLPGTNGLELIRTLKAGPGGEMGPHTLLITADRETDIPRLAVEAGADDFLFKPLDRNELLLRARLLLKLRYVLSRSPAKV